MFGSLWSENIEFDVFWLPNEHIIAHDMTFTVWDNDIESAMTSLTTINTRTGVRQAHKGRLYPDPELSFKTKMADIPLMIQEKIFGNRIDDNGVLVRTAQDKSPYYAVGFRSEKSDKTYRYVWLYKGATR